MRRILKYAAAGLGLAAGLAGCKGFLDSEKAVADPNAPTAATIPQLFVAIEANVFGQQEGPVAMLVCEWMQQCAGVGGRFVDTQGAYIIQPSSFNTSFASLYGAGGLIQIRDVKARADAAGDKLTKGITEVLEAMEVSWAADIWGDLPYREAAGDNPTPAFDPQMQIYADLQTLLDQAITDMNGGGPGPGFADLVYGGDKTKWIQAAHTLKARLYLHTVEKLGNASYASALTQANLGISTPANDWKTAHSSATSERNIWAQFQTSSFGNDLVAGSTLVDLMKAQNDPRLPEYFGTNKGGGYGGYDVHTKATNGDSISPILGSERTNDETFAQPIMTYDENQLIIAEAAFQTGAVATAQTALTNVRARYGKGPVPVTLQAIMQEKYILTFQNVEAWNDFKRTCIPLLLPAASKALVPGRIYYSATEEQTNPNTPSSANQNLFTVRNANDPNACPAS